MLIATSVECIINDITLRLPIYHRTTGSQGSIAMVISSNFPLLIERASIYTDLNLARVVYQKVLVQRFRFFGVDWEASKVSAPPS